jgi:hypothetical protein
MEIPMARTPSPATLAAASLAVGLIGFATGFAVSSAFPMTHAEVKPLIDSNAWNETAPVQSASYSAASAPQPRCNPWQITDVAMEEVLDEMLQRGWRAPTQGTAIALRDNAEQSGLAAIDPDAPMPSRHTWAASTSSDEDAVELPDEEIAEQPVAEPPATEPAPGQRPPS